MALMLPEKKFNLTWEMHFILTSVLRKHVYNLYLFQHVEVPIPTPSKDEVLIKVEAASINPFDWKVQKRMLWPLLPRKFPHIPGSLLSFSLLFRYSSLS